MIVLTLARKPLIGSVASNVFKYGTGGVNIDGCRVSTTDYLVAGGSLRKMAADGREGKALGFYQAGTPNTFQQNSEGRWPANLIFQHLLGCKCVGQRKVSKGGGTGTSTDIFCPGGAVRIGSQKHGFCVSHYDDDGKETVADWECQPGCPVRVLDEQSGVSSTPGPSVRKFSVCTHMGNIGKYAEGYTSIGYGDFDGASRFFKQVQQE